MGGGSINGRTKFDALLVVQIRLRKMSLVGVRQGNAEAEMAAGREGWHAIRTRILMHTKSDHQRKNHYETSYRVLACPQYEVG